MSNVTQKAPTQTSSPPPPGPRWRWGSVHNLVKRRRKTGPQHTADYTDQRVVELSCTVVQNLA
eukprot:1201760-Pyramimonas_sp.AAC.1